MAYPGPKVHRSNRRKLGRHQSAQIPAVTFTFSPSGSLATVAVYTVTANVSVVVTGLIPFVTSAAKTVASQTVLSPNTVAVTFSAATASTETYSIAAAVPTVTSFQGGLVAAVTGGAI